MKMMLLLAFMGILSSCSSANQNEGMMALAAVSGGSRIYEVREAAILASDPPQLRVRASGATRTGGWSNVRLEARVSTEPPADGIYVVDFVGTPPTGFATAAITPVSITNQLSVPKWARGVRVVAETNSREALIASAGEGAN